MSATLNRRWRRRPEGSNWGDFGDDDQIGRMNLLTAQHRLAAAKEVTEGVSFLLSMPLDYPGGAALNPRRKPPRLMVEQRGDGYNYNFCLCHGHAGVSDVVSDDSVLLWTQYSTQWDSLAHYGALFDADDDGKAEIVYYNGYRAHEDVRGPTDPGGPRAERLGIENMACAGIQGRGVLVDLHEVYGNARVAVGYDTLMRICEEQNALATTGDFLCVRTGLADLILQMAKTPDAEVLARSCPVLDGSDPRLLRWIDESGVVAICADNVAVEASGLGAAAQGERRVLLPLHEHCLFKLGLHLGELWYLTDLSRWLRDHRRSRFLLTAPPLNLPGAVGSPVSPVALV